MIDLHKFYDQMGDLLAEDDDVAVDVMRAALWSIVHEANILGSIEIESILARFRIACGLEPSDE